jgi:hypothetical protein
MQYWHKKIKADQQGVDVDDNRTRCDSFDAITNNMQYPYARALQHQQQSPANTRLADTADDANKHEAWLLA